MADINYIASTPADGPPPSTPDRDLEGRLHILAGQVGGIEEVLRMMYESKSCESEEALLLVMNVAGEVYLELKTMAEEVS